MANPKGYKEIPSERSTIARLYETNIVVDDGLCVTLNSGGYKTRHTLKCMNLYLDRYSMKIFQKKGEWYVTCKNGSTLPFRDGLCLSH